MNLLQRNFTNSRTLILCCQSAPNFRFKNETMSHFGRSGPPDISDTYSLLILNISFRTTADDLYPLFDKYGKIVDVFIPKDRRTGDSRGFAFVRYKYADEAQKAVDRLDGREVDGREITVQFAKYGPNAERIHKGRIIEKFPRGGGRSRSRSPRRSSRYRDDYQDSGYSRRSRSRSRNRYGRQGYRYQPIKAGVVATVQTMTEPVEGPVMMMSVGEEVGPLKVLVLVGAYHHSRIEFLLVAAHHQTVVFPQMIAILILGALHHIGLMRSDCLPFTMISELILPFT